MCCFLFIQIDLIVATCSIRVVSKVCIWVYETTIELMNNFVVAIQKDILNDFQCT